MKSKINFILASLASIIFIVLFIRAQEESQNFIYDEANLINNDDELNNLINEINHYKNSGVKIVVFTSSDEEKIKDKLKNGFYEYGLDKSEQNNFNVLIVYKPEWSIPALIYNEKCGLDIERIKHFIYQSQDLTQDENRLFEHFLLPETYDVGFEELLVFITEEMRFQIDKASCAIPKPITINPKLFPNIESIPVHKDILNRISPYQKYFEKGHSLYPAVPTNLAKSIVIKESSGIRTAIDPQNSVGLGQFLPCTAKDLRLVEAVKCLQCKDQTQKCNPCRSSCSKQGVIGYDYRLDAEKSIVAVYKYLDKRLKSCSSNNFVENVQDTISRLMNKGKKSENNFNDLEIRDEDIIKCALASYNYGHGNVIIAAAYSDSLKFDNYKSKVPFITRDYITKVLGYYKWLEENT